MRGIVKGEQCSKAWPLLQFFCRQGAFLVDPVSASFVIQDIHLSTVAPTTVVATTVLGSTHKLGVGRYALPTGSTAAWNYGTHRAVVTYTLLLGGPTFKQVVEFEVLSEVDWASSGADYRGYVSTRALFEDGYAVSGTDAVPTLHRLINKYSLRIEQWTGREFHPTYKSIYVAGLGTEYLLLREPIVVLEDMYYTWKGSDNTEQSQKIERSSYHVRVHHLDGEVGRDSRILSMLELASSWIGDGWNVRDDDNWTWSDRSRNYRLDGVFGYTDGALDPAGQKVDIGRTPEPLREVIAVLISRQLDDMTLTMPASMYPGRIDTIRTRDQSISFSSSSALASAVSDLFTGDPFLDMIIAKYVAPTEVIPVGRPRGTLADTSW